MTYNKDVEDILSCQTVGGEPPAILTLTIGNDSLPRYQYKVIIEIGSIKFQIYRITAYVLILKRVPYVVLRGTGSVLTITIGTLQVQ